MKFHNRVTGGELPKTSIPFCVVLLFGVVLTMIGIVGWKSRRRYE